MNIYKTKAKKISGTQYKEIYKKAHNFYKLICSTTKRRPYIRSAYFDKEKIFLDLFWHHLSEKKNFRDKIRRVKYFPCAIELIQKSRNGPVPSRKQKKKSEYFFRFAGTSQGGDIFFVQIKKDRKTNNKWLMSVFPANK